MKIFIFAFIFSFGVIGFSQEESMTETSCGEVDSPRKWYLEFKPGYYYFTDQEMRSFFDDGGFTFRLESGCKFWGPMIVWLDMGYLQKEGKSIGGFHPLEMKLGTITLGLKIIHYFGSRVAIYAGAGPRLFMLLLKNDSPFVRSNDNEIGVGGGFDAGLWLFPICRWPNFFLDLFADYSWKNMKVDADEISSVDYGHINLSGTTAGLGVGYRF